MLESMTPCNPISNHGMLRPCAAGDLASSKWMRMPLLMLP
jgi:hypothetical protein